MAPQVDSQAGAPRQCARPRTTGPGTVPGVGREAGSVTAEAAVVLPSLFVVLAVALFVLACVSAQLRCTDAAGLAARAAARGDSVAVVQEAARAVAPEGAEVQVARRGPHVEVVVRARVRPFGGAVGPLGPVHVSGRAVAAREDLGAQ